MFIYIDAVPTDHRLTVLYLEFDKRFIPDQQRQKKDVDEVEILQWIGRNVSFLNPVRPAPLDRYFYRKYEIEQEFGSDQRFYRTNYPGRLQDQIRQREGKYSDEVEYLETVGSKFNCLIKKSKQNSSGEKHW